MCVYVNKQQRLPRYANNYFLLTPKFKVNTKYWLYLISGFTKLVDCRGNDQEIKFHEIEIGVFHEIKSFLYKILHNCSGEQKGS
jgi:hypothetical protein